MVSISCCWLVTIECANAIVSGYWPSVDLVLRHGDCTLVMLDHLGQVQLGGDHSLGVLQCGHVLLGHHALWNWALAGACAWGDWVLPVAAVAASWALTVAAISRLFPCGVVRHAS